MGRLIMLHKKGCRNNPNNYKVLSSILLHRIAVVDNTIPDCQNGIRPERECRDNLYILREVIKDQIEQGEHVQFAYLWTTEQHLPV